MGGLKNLDTSDLVEVMQETITIIAGIDDFQRIDWINRVLAMFHPDSSTHTLTASFKILGNGMKKKYNFYQLKVEF